MNTQIKKDILGYWEQWIKKRNPIGNPQVLHAKNTYILPSSFGWLYGILLLTLFSGAINYQISTVFLMTFLLAGVGLVSAWEAQSNLRELRIQLIAVEDAQQGTPAQMTLFIHSSSKMRFSLAFQIGKQSPVFLEKIPTEGMSVVIPIATSTRGYFALPNIIISSLFPFGIFRVWGYACFNEHYYVYPQPLSPGFWPTPLPKQSNTAMYTAGDDELFDLKQVENPWNQPNLIAWKIAAKGQGWYLKTMSSMEGDKWLFRLKDLPSGDLETKLQHLSYWLQSAEANGYCYSLELSQPSAQCAQGDEYLKYSLRQLARYQ